MPIPFIAAAGASLLGAGANAFSQSRIAKNNLRAQQDRQRTIDAGAAQNQSSINDSLGGISQLLQALAGQQSQTQQANPTAFQFDPITGTQVSAPTYNASGADLPGQIAANEINFGDLFGGSGSQGFNVGQDALMQFLRADPQGKMQGTNAVLQEIAATGLPSDLSSIFTQATDVNRANNADILASVTGRSGSVGQRFGSATRRLEGDTARRLVSEQSLQNSQLALQIAEAASGRRLQAASQLGSFQLQGAGQLLNAGNAQTGQVLQALLANQGANLQADTFNANTQSETSRFNAAAQNQAGSQNAAQMLQAMLANQSNTQRTNEFNVSAGMQANQQNNAQMMQAIFGNNQQATVDRQLQASILGQAGGVEQQRNALLNQLLGIRSGVQTPQGSGAGGQAISNGFNDLASILTLYNRYGTGNTPSLVDSIPTQMTPINIRR